MADLLYEALQGVNFDGRTVELLLESQGISGEYSTPIDTQATSVTEEDDVFQCGKCKKQFTSFQSFILHKKEHVQGSLSKLDNDDILLSLEEDKDGTCSADDQRQSTDTAYNQLTIDTLATDASIIFSENDILSFAINSSSLSLSPCPQTTPSFPCVVQPEEFLSPSTTETTVSNMHKGKNNSNGSYSCAAICTSQLTENSTGTRLPSIHSITNRTKTKNIEASVDVCSIDDVNFSVPSTKETNDQCHMIFPEMTSTSGAGKYSTEKIVNYEEAALESAATVLLDYSNGQTMKACSMLLPCVESGAVQNSPGKNISKKVQNENTCGQENIVIDYSNSCIQTNAKSVEIKNNMNTEIKKTKTKKKAVVSVVEKHKAGDKKSAEQNANEQNQQSSRSMLKCSFCTKLFTKNFDLQQHIRSHTGEKPFQCVVCGRAFTQKSNAKKHMNSHKVWPKDQTTLPKRAIQLLGKENDESCQENEGTEATHVDAVMDCPTLQKSYACQFCDKTYSVYTELKSHIFKNHSDQKVYKCLQKRCLQTFPDLESFLEHTNNHHVNGLQYRCHVCNKRFDSLETLGVHQYSHGNHANSASKTLARGLVCYKCKRKFTSHAALEHHMDTSSHNFPCPFCGKVFTWERYLRRHLVIHGPEKSFSCSVCGKCFRAEMYLKAHMLTHSDTRPFACQHCGATFIRKDKLVRHLLIHQTIKKFKCPFHTYLGCSREFTRQDKLKCHILTHTLTKPLRCKRCNKTFHRPSLLREHERLYCQKDLEQKCSDCGLVFRSKVQLSSHLCITVVGAPSAEQTSDMQERSEAAAKVQKTSRSRRKRTKKVLKGEASKASKVHIGGGSQKNKVSIDENMSTIEVIVVPVSVNNSETTENHSEGGNLYVTFPSTPSAGITNTSELFDESQYTSIILSTDQQYDENIPELNIANNCDNLTLN